MERQTRQRRAIRLALQRAPGPLRPSEILESARSEVAELGLATVYRNLNALVETGGAHAINLPGEPTRFELADKGHHHYFSCSSCQTVYDLSSCIQQGLTGLVPPGFHLESHEIVLYGKCEACS